MMARLIESEGRWIRALLILSTVTVGLVLAWLVAQYVVYFSDIILVVVMAWLFAFVLSPLVTLMRRALPGVPRNFVVVSVYALLFLVLSAVVAARRGAAGAARSRASSTTCPVSRSSFPRSSRRTRRSSRASASRSTSSKGANEILTGIADSAVDVRGPAPADRAREPRHDREPAVHGLPVALHRHRQGAAHRVRQPHHATALRRRDAPVPDVGRVVLRRLHPRPGDPGRHLRRDRRRRAASRSASTTRR